MIAKFRAPWIGPRSSGRYAVSEGVVVAAHLLEVPPGEDHGGDHEDGGQAGQPRAQLPDGEVDADGDPARRPEAGEPVDGVPMSRAHHDHGEHDRDHGGGEDGDGVEGASPPLAAEKRVQGRYRRRHEQRRGGGQSRQVIHGGPAPQPLNWTSSCGSRVPNRL